MEKEYMDRARQAQSRAELSAHARESGMEMTGGRAKAYFEKLNFKADELSDDELDNVAGGVHLHPKKLF